MAGIPLQRPHHHPPQPFAMMGLIVIHKTVVAHAQITVGCGNGTSVVVVRNDLTRK